MEKNPHKWTHPLCCLLFKDRLYFDFALLSFLLQKNDVTNPAH